MAKELNFFNNYHFDCRGGRREAPAPFQRISHRFRQFCCLASKNPLHFIVISKKIRIFAP